MSRLYPFDFNDIARPVGRVELGWRWCQRKPVVSGLMAIVALVLILGATVAGYFGYDARREASEKAVEANKAKQAQ